MHHIIIDFPAANTCWFAASHPADSSVLVMIIVITVNRWYAPFHVTETACHDQSSPSLYAAAL